MGPPDRDDRYDEVKRCLAEADRAFARAGAVTDERERIQLIEEAETWLVRAERRLAKLTERPISVARPNVVANESRSFGDTHAARSKVWGRLPKA
jgi:hypothetical protein